MDEYPYTLIPKDKHDISTISELMLLSDDDMELIVYDLLIWIKDINWPVATKIVQVLSHRGRILNRYIVKLLSPEQNDEIWKYWIISQLIPKLTDRPSAEVIKSIQRIAKHPTVDELSEEVSEVAKEVLSKI